MSRPTIYPVFYENIPLDKQPQEMLIEAVAWARWNLGHLTDTREALPFCADWVQWRSDAFFELRATYGDTRPAGWPRVFDSIIGILKETQRRAGFITL